MDILYSNLLNFGLGEIIMIIIGGILIYLAIAKDMEPTLLLPMGFGAILVNIIKYAIDIKKPAKTSLV